MSGKMRILGNVAKGREYGKVLRPGDIGCFFQLRSFLPRMRETGVESLRKNWIDTQASVVKAQSFWYTSQMVENRDYVSMLMG